MNMLFANTMKKLREEKGLSQNEIAKRMYVTRTAVSRWESGHRLPDAAMITRLSDVLGVNVNILISAAAQSDESPIVIMVDDNKVFLNDGMPIIEEVIPNAAVIGFTDSHFSPLSQYCDHVLLAKSDMLSFVDSLAAPLSLVNALIVALASGREQSLSRTFDVLEQVWDQYNVYEKRVGNQ